MRFSDRIKDYCWTLSCAILCSLYSIILTGTAQAQSGAIVSYTKISHTSGEFKLDLDERGFFGQSICTIGDLDKDGINDLAVGFHADKSAKPESRAIWILFMNEDGTIKPTSRRISVQADSTKTVANRTDYGYSIAALGDLNGDKIPDLAVGEPEDHMSGMSKGAIWILFMNSDGSVKSEIELGHNNMSLEKALEGDDNFGCSMSAFKDLNGDDIPDLVVGARRDDDGGQHNQGAVYILFLTRDGAISKFQKISQTEGNFQGKLSESDLFGTSVSNIGDLNNDGTEDIAVGSYFADGANRSTGAVWILFLTPEGSVKSHHKIAIDEKKYKGDLSSLTFFGKSIASPGDLNQDGIQDLVIGANDKNGEFKGELLVAFMNRDGTVISFQKINSQEGGFAGTISNGDQFGHSVTSLGDLDKNGINDIAVGATFDDDGGPNRGAVWILNMAKRTKIKGMLLFNQDNPVVEIDIKILNGQGQEIGVTKTDEAGIFTFENLSLGGKYHIQLASGGVSLSDKANIFIVNDGGEHVKLLLKSGKDSFPIVPNTRSFYNQLKPLVDVDNRLFTVTVKGQLFKEQPGDLPEGASVFITNQEQEVLYATKIDEVGNFKFIRQSPKENYSIRSMVGGGDLKLLVKNKKGEILFEAKMDRDGKVIYERFKPDEEIISLKAANDETITVKEGEEFNLNIFFAPAASSINHEAMDILDIIVTLLKRNPHIAIEIAAHTDSNGDEENNLALSRKRAERVVKYMYEKGIEIKRIDAKGYGETKLKNKCADGVTCTDNEHKVNRRVEVIIKKLRS